MRRSATTCRGKLAWGNNHKLNFALRFGVRPAARRGRRLPFRNCFRRTTPIRSAKRSRRKRIGGVSAFGCALHSDSARSRRKLASARSHYKGKCNTIDLHGAGGVGPPKRHRARFRFTDGCTWGGATHATSWGRRGTLAHAHGAHSRTPHGARSHYLGKHNTETAHGARLPYDAPQPLPRPCPCQYAKSAARRNGRTALAVATACLVHWPPPVL